MPDIKQIAAKLANNPLSQLQIYPQDASVDIDTMLNTSLTNMWNDISQNTLAQDELDECMGTFANAIITNLVDKKAQSDLDLLFTNTLSCYSNGNIDSIYLSQLLRKNHLPDPSGKVIYTTDDVCQAAKTYDSQHDAMNKSALLANIGAFYLGASALFILMDDQQDLDNFKLVANSALSKQGLDIIPDDFVIDNKIFDGIILRQDFKLANPENDPNSVARVLGEVLTKTCVDFILPTKTIESLLPSILVFFNAKKLARATSTEILNAKNNIHNLAQLDKSRILSFKNMATLSAVQKQITKQQMMQNQLNNLLAKSAKSSSTGVFAIKEIDMSRVKQKIMKIEKKMKNQEVSRNPKLYFTDTYQRQNRREPENIDLPGIAMDYGYYPDIHLYVDTSGSITQADYEDSVSMIIDIAKRLNCDIYFNSFTTDISQETVVRCRNRSKRQIQKDIEKIPKLTGGTTIDQVWNYINATKKNRKQLSILISDFYVDVPRYIQHPINLYYIPTRGTSTKYAQTFANRLPNPWRVLF